MSLDIKKIIKDAIKELGDISNGQNVRNKVNEELEGAFQDAVEEMKTDGQIEAPQEPWKQWKVKN